MREFQGDIYVTEFNCACALGVVGPSLAVAPLTIQSLRVPWSIDTSLDARPLPVPTSIRSFDVSRRQPWDYEAR